MTGPGTDDESDNGGDEGRERARDADGVRPGPDDDERPDPDERPVPDDSGQSGSGDPPRDEPGGSGPPDPGDSDGPPAEPTDEGSDAAPAEAAGPPTPGTKTRSVDDDGRLGSIRSTDDGRRDDGPPIPSRDGEPSFDGPIDWFFNTDDAFVQTVRDVASSLATVAILGLVLFAISGIWPPLVAVESGSMEPHMHKNDLVFIVEENRFVGSNAQAGTGVVTHRAAAENDGYWSFGDYGNVIVYQPDGSQRRTPIIHRAHFWVEEGENWVDDPAEGGTGKANAQYLSRSDSAATEFDCDDVRSCPADYDGFVTKGDDNAVYDQVGGQSSTVKSDWIRGKAKVRIPLLGWIRLQFAQLATTFGGAGPTAIAALRLQSGLTAAGVGAVVARRRGFL